MKEIQLNNSQNAQLSLSENQFNICKEIYHVNQLTAFPVNDERLSEWARSIEEIVPNLEIEDLKNVIIDFKIGELEYNHKEGVQNIFFGLRTNYGGKYFPKKY